MARTYLPVLLLMGFVIMNAIMMVGLSALTMRARPTPDKQVAYESGMLPLGDARERFSVKFYMVAISFIIFDVETVLMLPWAADFLRMSCVSPMVDGTCARGDVSFMPLVAMLIFLAILTIGLVYEWKKGAFQWD